MSKVRIDTLLVQQGKFQSKSRAAAAVLAGSVYIGSRSRKANKPGQLVAVDTELSVQQAPMYVSRGGQKLANALAQTGVEVAGKRCLDIGASTGGFTDCLLKNSTQHVIAVDVAYGELEWKIRNDSRVTVIERCNARALTPAQLDYAAEVVVIDVSFISLRKILPAAINCAAAEFNCLALVKPQFEIGKGRVGRGGVVRNLADRREVLLDIAAFSQQSGYGVMGFASSKLPGPKGNRETFIWLVDGEHEGTLSTFEEAVDRIEL